MKIEVWACDRCNKIVHVPISGIHHLTFEKPPKEEEGPDLCEDCWSTIQFALSVKSAKDFDKLAETKSAEMFPE